MPNIPPFLRKVMLYFHGPEIYSKLSDGPKYQSNFVGTTGNLMVNLIRAIARAAYCAWPVTAFFLYIRTNRFSDFSVLFFYFQVYSLSLLIRLFGRLFDPEYTKLVDLLVTVYENPDDRKAKDLVLRKYDIELLQLPLYSKVAAPEGLYYPDLPAEWSYTNPLSWISFFAIHTFGRRMIFPGSTLLLNYLVHKTLVDHRFKFLTEENARRIPVQSADGYTIDAIYIKNGPKTVFVCDGNAGFYEGALWRNFLTQGNSIIAWNAPGFGSSTGKPHTNREIFNAADAVMKFANTELNIPPEDIIIYGWSIGGLAASWLSANYNVHAVLLDATFDSILPLAHRTMPELVADIVTYAIGSYFHMPVAEMIARYPGRVAIFRRVFDEIIVTENDGTEKGRLSTNRANYLLETFLKLRFPFIKWNQDDILYLHLVLSEPTTDSHLLGGPPFSMLSRDRCGIVTGEARKTMIRRLIHAFFFDVNLGHNAALPYHMCVVPQQYNPPDN